MATTDSQDDAADIQEFLRRYYRDAIGELAEGFPSETKSLPIDWLDIFRFDPDLADEYRRAPARCRDHFEQTLAGYDLPVDVDLAGANVRVFNVPGPHTYPIGAYRSDSIGEYIAVDGQVQKQTEVHPTPVVAAWECDRCGTTSEVPQSDGEVQEPHECPGCERQGPFSLAHKQSKWTDTQLLRLQRPPEQTKGGTSPTLDIHTRDDLVGECQAGDRVTIAGTLTIDPDATSHGFKPQLQAHHIRIKQTDYENINIDQHLDDIYAITSGERGDPYDLLVASIGPDIQGMQTIKKALALQLFGGVRCEYPDGTHDRGDPHILLLGDPGTAKSSLLKDVEKKAPRSTYASGKGATAAGMTAAAVTDDFGEQEYSLQAGALVEADKGIACVDEIDKIREDARASMHEALSHQTIHINKAGINAHLPTRTALLAAGNPEYGRFREDKPIAQQINLGPTLLSRFDLLFMIDDQPDPERDAEIIEGMIETRRAAARYTADDRHEDIEEIAPAVETPVLRAWVAHAKQTVTPTIENPEVAADLKDSFHDLRQVNGGGDGPVPVTFRKLEGLMRLAEASARVRLSDTITHDDIDRARELIGRSMSDVGMDPDAGVFDADIIETGEAASQQDKRETVLAIVTDAAGSEPAGHETVVERGDDGGLSQADVEYAIKMLKEKGRIYEPQSDRYRPT